MTKLLMHVGMNVGDKRFEPGERVDASDLTDKQRRFLVKEGYATEVTKGERLPADAAKPIEAGELDPHEVVAAIDTKEEV